MKRILMLCSMFVLLFALSVPVFATDAEYTITGSWKFSKSNSIIYSGSLVESVNGIVYADNASTGKSFTSVTVNNNMMHFDGSSWSYPDGRLSVPLRVDFGSTPKYISADFADFISTWAISDGGNLDLLRCDGSTCPASDGNMDNVCDDCGMTFAVLRDYTLPDPYAVWTDQTTYPYAMVTLGNNLYLLPSLPFYYDIGSYIRHEGGTYERYKIEDGQWVYDYTSSNPVNLGALEDVQHSSFDLNYEGAILIYRDSDFFPKSLQEVIQEGVSEMARKTGGTMTILVACGVGLMACLMVLSLFGKRSLISLR